MKRTIFLIVLAAAACAFAQEPATTQSDTDPEEIRRGMETGGTPEQRARRFYEQVIAKVEPSLRGDVNNMHQYLELFTREFVEDPRTFATKLDSDIIGDNAAAIYGYLEFPEHKAALATFFKYLSLPGVVDRTELLPSAELGESKFGVIASPRASFYDRPGSPETRRERVTECLQGETIYLLKKIDTDYLAHAPSGYVGFVATKDVKAINEMRLAEIESAISVQRGSQIETMIAAAIKLKGTKYVWGGVSSEGIDCSGLVYTSFKTIGVQMPRDADQQYLVGRLIGTRWHRDLLRRGDLLFFLGRQGTVSHVAIYLGDKKFLEASGQRKEGMVKVSSFDPNDANYAEKRDKSFCFAKRVIE